MMDTEIRGFQGLWIPAALWMDETLSLLEKAIVADVLSFDKYYKSNAKMAKFFGVTERRIQQTIKEMEEKNLIVRVAAATESGRTLGRTIKLSQAYHQKLYPRPFPEMAAGSGEEGSGEEGSGEENFGGEENFVGRAKKISSGGEENFALYRKNTDENTERDTTTATTSSSHSSTWEKAGKEEEEGRRGKKYFTPPEYDEVARYVAEHSYQVDAYEFWSFYEKRDWMANGKRIRDWRKCLDRWEESEKAKGTFASAARINQAMMDAPGVGFDFVGAMRDGNGR